MSLRFFNTYIHIIFESKESYDNRKRLREYSPLQSIKKGNPTPRKCRGHKKSAEYENRKCLTCGGVK